MYKTYSMDLAGRTLSVDIGRVGKQAGGCAFIHYGDTTLLCTATQSAAVLDSSEIEDLEGLRGKKIAVKTGTQGASYAESLADEYEFNITYYEDSPSMYQAVTGGQADACFEDTPIMADSIKSGGLNMKVLENTANEGSDYGFAVFSADKQELIDAFNAGLANIRENGKYDEIISKYLGAE